VTSNEPSSWIPAIDATLERWSQGDCTIGEDCWFVTRFDPQRPLTPDAADVVATSAEADLTESSVSGFVVVTQTCDDQYLQDIHRLKRPRYAYIAGVAEFNLVADLDRVMTVEKAVVAGWERISGCPSDADTRLLGEALARKRSRFAFPDDFNEFAQKLQKRMHDKHEKSSTEGKALRALLEIRVSAAPAWDAEDVALIFWFIRAEADDLFENQAWHELLDSWLKLLPPSARFSAVDGTVVSLDDMTAKEYLHSDRLDLDRLSSHRSSPELRSKV
jgi:hypothetical protein